MIMAAVLIGAIVASKASIGPSIGHELERFSAYFAKCESLWTTLVRYEGLQGDQRLEEFFSRFPETCNSFLQLYWGLITDFRYFDDLLRCEKLMNSLLFNQKFCCRVQESRLLRLVARDVRLANRWNAFLPGPNIATEVDVVEQQETYVTKSKKASRAEEIKRKVKEWTRRDNRRRDCIGILFFALLTIALAVIFYFLGRIFCRK